MHIRSWLTPLIVALALPATAIAGDKLTPNALFDKPDKQVNIDKIKNLGKSKKVLLPTVTLQLLATGDLFASTGGNSAKMKYATVGLDKAYVQQLAAEAQQDLAAKMTAAGYEVIGWEQIKDRPDVKEMERRKPGKGIDLPLESPRGSSNDYLFVSPSDEQAIKPAMQGLFWTFRKVAKDLDATMLEVIYVLDAPQVWSESERGYKRSSVSVNSAPGMTMTSARITLATAKMAGGSLMTTGYMTGVSENVGTLSQVKDDTPSGANALSSALSMLGGGSSINRKSGVYVFQVDQPAYATAVRKATTSVNGLFAEAAAEHAPKK